MAEQNKYLRAALAYHQLGFSVVPVPDTCKGCLVKWTPYQTERPTEQQLRAWWQEHPDARVSVICGKVSDVIVVDCDTQDGLQKVLSLLPETASYPMASTPRGGRHIWFKYQNGFRSGLSIIPGVDIKTNGGMIAVPPDIRVPTKGKPGGAYEWLDGLNIREVPLSPIPPELLAVLFSRRDNNDNGDSNDNIDSKNHQRQHSDNTKTTCDNNDNNDNIGFEEGRRDQTIFHLATHLVKSGMPEENILIYLNFVGKNCNPPFPPEEVKKKLASALSRRDTRERNLTGEVRELLLSHVGEITTSYLYNNLGVSSREDKKKILSILSRLVLEEVLIKSKTHAGTYRIPDKECPEVDWKNASPDHFPIRLPFQLNRLVRIGHKAIIVVAGEQNAGKTAILFNILRLNMDRGHETYYFQSEMGCDLFQDRILRFEDIPKEDWTFHLYDRVSNFVDVIRPDGINFIDYLEISDAFYKVAGMLTEIYAKLSTGIAIVALQKDSKTALGRGGSFSMEKPTLYLAVEGHPPDYSLIRIMKAKTWADSRTNPNRLERKFNIVNGCKIIPLTEWEHPKK